jgi:phage repressor protein C with HTH and peptisase S24 domain
VRVAVTPKSQPAMPASGAGQAAFMARLQAVARHWPSSDSLAKAAGVSIGWLAKGDGTAPDLPPHDSVGQGSVPGKRLESSAFLLLPRQPEAVAAGAGTPAPPALITEFIAFRHDWVRDTFDRAPGDLILETAMGDSMEPHIRNGDHLLVDTTENSFRNFGIYVMEMRGERIVKRVQRLFNGTLILISDNRIYQPEEIPAEDAAEVHVVGRVVWRGGRV